MSVEKASLIKRIIAVPFIIIVIASMIYEIVTEKTLITLSMLVSINVITPFLKVEE